jgi:branched-chain amino acid transport system ATP-binding protein
LLHIQALHVGYGSVSVLRGVTLELLPSGCTAVLGRNGVGKTTLLRSIVGLIPPKSGSVYLGNRDITGLPPYQIARLGIALVPQGRGILSKLTVRENLLAGTRAAGKNARIPAQVYEYFPVLKERLNHLGGTLSGGQQQMLALARALCGSPNTNPQIE